MQYFGNARIQKCQIINQTEATAETRKIGRLDENGTNIYSAGASIDSITSLGFLVLFMFIYRRRFIRFL